MSTPIRRATSADSEELVGILVDGFAGDPILMWIYETDEQYRRLAPELFRWVVERTLNVGEAYVAEDGAGTLLGQASSTLEVSDEEDEQIELQLRTVGSDAAEHLLAFMKATHDNHPIGDTAAVYAMWRKPS
ncbi:hypothetical protein [Micromonospora sp. HUAS LYJ1]|uniref:hypothetical protein n=1 Tax=Micromonospora sp. HUAS LYJ1 TaxID=3061626 RepID=UPI002673FC41|nr:hypothetical protein [Micromonospora sp. HUAS LYJ1]WKU05637.1 hypothetical protein Q2K16_00790 [Micromonospora sp. HUAS LYJ1]